MPQRYHKKPNWNKQGLKLSPRQLDRYQNTGATMLSGNQSQVQLSNKIEDNHHEST